MTVTDLSPSELWQNFAALNAIPRASKKEEAVIQFMLQFGNKLNLQTMADDIGNVIIKNRQQPVWKIGKPFVCRATWIWYIKKMPILILIL